MFVEDEENFCLYETSRIVNLGIAMEVQAKPAATGAHTPSGQSPGSVKMSESLPA
jgi:hypothetical protein